MLKIIFRTFKFLLFIPLVGCVSGISEPRLSKQTVITLVEGYLSDRKTNIKKYSVDDILYSYTDKNWTFLYISKDLRLGGHFYLQIDDSTKMIEFIPGL